MKCEPIESANVDWYFMAPVMHDPPLCRMIELEDGTYDINHLADMHEVMLEEAEYNRRMRPKGQ